MKNLPTLFFQELRTHLYSPATYAAAVLFMLLMGVIYVLLLSEAAQAPNTRTVPEDFFQLFFIPVWFMVPMLTMRSFAEERRLGTLETLLTTPVSTFEIVLSKFLSAYTLFFLLWALTLLFPLAVATVSPPAIAAGQLQNFSTLLGGYAFIAVSGILYTAVGIFTSSLTRSQLIAGMLSFCILFIFIVGAKTLALIPVAQTSEVLSLTQVPEYLRTFQHLEDFTRGVLDTRPFFFYISNALLMLGLTTLYIRRKA